MPISSQLHLEPHCSACHIFLKEGREEIRTAWLVPHKLVEREDRLFIQWSCNLGRVCQNSSCIYSHGERSRERGIPEPGRD